MKQIYHACLVIVSLLLIAGCETLHMPDGKRKYQLMPATVRDYGDILTDARFDYGPFLPADWVQQRGVSGNRHKVQFVTAEDLRRLAGQADSFYVYLCYTTCPGSKTSIHTLDSFARTGARVWVLSLEGNYQVFEDRLKGTAFARVPYYMLDGANYAARINRRLVEFIRDVCPECYEHYRDELIYADILFIHQHKVEVLTYKDRRNPLTTNGNLAGQ